jgi:putative SOS response-associated peptidase YedK
MVEQGLKALGETFRASVQMDLFEELFRRRLVDDRVKLSRALEAQFDEPESSLEEQIHAHIVQYRLQLNQRYEAELLKQKERLTLAQRKLQVRSTKGALEEQRIASNRVRLLYAKLEDLRRTELEPADNRIFPFWYAPVVVETPRGRVVQPMRYHCRGQGKPENSDERFPGLYNARRDSLDGYWREQFGSHHGVLVIQAFYENVSRNAYEHRAKNPGERAENLVIRFRPETAKPLHVACLWDRWQQKDSPSLWSFAAITDSPPPEVAAAGHDRCVVILAERNLSAWLAPNGKSDAELQRLLSDRDPIVFVHDKAS